MFYKLKNVVWSLSYFLMEILLRYKMSNLFNSET